VSGFANSLEFKRMAICNRGLHQGIIEEFFWDIVERHDNSWDSWCAADIGSLWIQARRVTPWAKLLVVVILLTSVLSICIALCTDRTGVKTEFTFGTLQLLNTSISDFLISRYATAEIANAKISMGTKSTAEITQTRANTRAHCPGGELPRWCQAQSSVRASNQHENTQ
jgi:hypothetical protein